MKNAYYGNALGCAVRRENQARRMGRAIMVPPPGGHCAAPGNALGATAPPAGWRWL